MTHTSRTLVFGFGNPGRLDDGLGPAVVAALEAWRRADIETDSNYQLSVEDAATIVQYDRIVFVDASLTGPEPYSVEQLTPEEPRATFSSHSLSPQLLLGLARQLYGCCPDAWLIGVRGYDFGEFGEGLSSGAARNLEVLLADMPDIIKKLGKEEVCRITSE